MGETLLLTIHTYYGNLISGTILGKPYDLLSTYIYIYLPIMVTLNPIYPIYIYRHIYKYVYMYPLRELNLSSSTATQNSREVWKSLHSGSALKSFVPCHYPIELESKLLKGGFRVLEIIWRTTINAGSTRESSSEALLFFFFFFPPPPRLTTTTTTTTTSTLAFLL